MVVIEPADAEKQSLVGPPAVAASGENPPIDRPLFRRRGLSVPATLDIAPAAGARPRREGEYTSLRDVIAWPAPAAGVSSPATTPGPGGGCCEIRIKNRLVQQAAHAYLQPTPTARGNRHRGLLSFSCGELFSRFFQFLCRICRSVYRALCLYGERNVFIIQIKY